MEEGELRLQVLMLLGDCLRIWLNLLSLLQLTPPDCREIVSKVFLAWRVCDLPGKTARSRYLVAPP